LKYQFGTRDQVGKKIRIRGLNVTSERPGNKKKEKVGPWKLKLAKRVTCGDHTPATRLQREVHKGGKKEAYNPRVIR